ncbi:MAG TPA: phospholipase D-like domain-containing protein [Rhodopila sp.]|nr:phospholipase D-like domain-containing protein [Rhodopila sp.]
MALSRPNRFSRRQLATLAAAGLLARCASVPHVDGLTPRDVALRGHPARPDAPAVSDTDALQQQYDLQRGLSDSPIVFGNAVTLLPSGADAFQSIFEAIGGARDCINLEYFILADVQSNGLHLSDLLLDRLRAGVKVNMIYDSFGSKDTPGTFFDALRAAGAKVVEFNPINPLATRTGWSPNDRDHRKITVVDGRIGFTGGINMDKVYENPPSAGVPADGNTSHAYWRDTAVRIEGPAVADLQRLFFETWKAQKAPPADAADYFPQLARQGVQTVRIIGSSPGRSEPLYYASLLTAARSARRRVWLCSGYFLPPHQERKELARIARSGTDVRIVAPAFSDVQSAVYAARAAYGDLLEAGARIYEVTDAVVHAKLAVVDDTWTMVGSSNLDRRSVVFNNEVDAVVLGHDTAGQVEAVMLRYMQDARQVSLAKWNHRSLQERMRELEARVWQYWM